MSALIERFKQNPIVRSFLNPDTFKQLLRYVVVGLFCFSVEYSLFLIFRDKLHANELLVNISVYTVIFWVNFLLNKYFSFKSRNNFKKQLLSYGVLFLFNLVVGNLLLFSGIRYILVLGFGEGSFAVKYLPKILIMFFIVSWNFVLYKKWIYK